MQPPIRTPFRPPSQRAILFPNPVVDPMTASRRRFSLIAAIGIALSACAIPPKPTLPPLRDEAPLAGLPVPANGQWPEAEWWKRYADTQLDDLEARALADAPSLDEAHRRLETVIRSVQSARAALGLQSQLNANVTRNRLSQTLGLPEGLAPVWYNLGALNVQAQYDFDFFGKTHAAIEGAVDQARAADAERSAATLTLTTAVADAYFGWQADQRRLALARDSVDTLTRYRTLSAKRVERGIDAPDYLHQADERIAAVREAQAGYEGSAQLRLAALAALLGTTPAELPKLQARPLPTVDARLPDDIGIDLVARRPDVAAARWRVEAAMRQVDRARAEFYPDISLAGTLGLQTLDLDKLLNFDSRTLGIGPALHLPLFQRAQLKAAYGVSQAQLQAAASQYDASVVDAAHDVATQALNLTQAQARRKERDAQIAAAEQLHALAVARTRQGIADERTVLSAQSDILQQRDAAATLDAQAVSAQLALIKALGGGYRSDVANASQSHSPSSDRTESQ